MPGFREAVLRFLLAALLSSAAGASAQQADPAAAPQPAAPDHPYTLHVYTDLMQMPALVVDERGRPLPNLTGPSFQLQLDAGPVFHPTAVHLEGEDPIDLALVIDASGAENDLVSVLTGTPGHGLPVTLLPHDHVSVYAFDCHELSTRDAPVEVALAHKPVEEVLASPNLHSPGAPNQTCRSTKRLWDVLAAASRDLAAQPGRRALLVLADGEDGGSSVTPQSLRYFVASTSISIFVLREEHVTPAANPGGYPSLQMRTAPSRDELGSLAESSGGFIFRTDPKRLAGELEHFVSLLRNRYILQFPRPANEQGGHHQIETHVSDRHAIVRVAGTSVPMRDAALMADPNTVPADPSKMPVYGNKKSPR